MMTINIYRHNGMWSYAAMIDGEHDHTDTLPDAESETDATAAVAEMFDGADVRRVADVDDASSDDDTDTLVCGCQVQYDNSGVGHNWRDIAADDINADVRQAIECEIIDGKITACNDWTGPDGQHYRWTEA